MPHPNIIKRKLRRPFETAGFKLLQVLIPLMPRGAVVGLAKLAGKLAWLLPLCEKKIGLKNLDAVFGDTKTDAEKRRILTSSFVTFTQTMLDLFWFSRNPEKRIEKFVEIDPSMHGIFLDKASLFLSAHLGSWELLAQTVALHGSDVAGIAAPIKNKTIDRLFIQHREKTGQTIIPRKGALRTLVGRLRKNGIVGFALDQNTSEDNGGIIIDFLGFPTPISPAPAALAYRTGSEIFFGYCIPLPKGRYRLYSPGTLQPPAFDKAKNTQQITKELTQQIVDRLAVEILKHPENWIWVYRHWRRTAGQTYPKSYPDY